MKIERCPLIMRNLVCFKAVLKEEEWEKGFELLRNLEFLEGMYQNGPLFFSMEQCVNEPKYKNFEFFMPVNVSIEGLNNDRVDFVEELTVPDAIMMRQADNEDNFSVVQTKLAHEAIKFGFEVENKAYCVCTEIYKEMIIDVYLPLKGGEDL